MRDVWNRVKRPQIAAAACALLLAGAAAPAGAQSYMMTISGGLDARSSILTGSGRSVAFPRGGYTPFTLTAYFNTNSPNLAAPVGVPGFVAYSPTSIQMSFAGKTFGVQSYSTANPYGFAVAIFDQTTPFGPGHYAAGVIADPLADGAGIVGDYTGATTPFQLGSTGVVPTTFTGYFGVGIQGGVCINGTGGNCNQYAVQPVPLTYGNEQYGLVLGNYDQNAGPHDPVFNVDISAVPQITSTPEPGALALLATGFVGVAGAVRRRARRA